MNGYVLCWSYCDVRVEFGGWWKGVRKWCGMEEGRVLSMVKPCEDYDVSSAMCHVVVACGDGGRKSKEVLVLGEGILR